MPIACAVSNRLGTTIKKVCRSGYRTTNIHDHPLTISLREDQSWTEFRKAQALRLSLMALDNDQDQPAPISFLRKSATQASLKQIIFLRSTLCGHPDTIHGGILAALLDEGLTDVCFQLLPSEVGVTASLAINYHKPCYGNTFVVLSAETTKIDGRKAWGDVIIETLPKQGDKDGGELIASGKGLIVDPKGWSQEKKRHNRQRWWNE